ncbi:hypothetical protein [Prevotella corporis]|uniref:hypothetical protein n=1 Tax=Prevotella corporis TaxID=28128 RepID=UPI0023F7D9AA|nr:hypothetical protein [Prevotella corporis]
MTVRKISHCLLLGIILMVASCGKSEKTDDGMIAAHAAKLYYENLIRGKGDQFLDGTDMPDMIPDDYRRQLLKNFEQFCVRQKEEHKGIDSVSINHAEFFEKDSTASVFLLLHFGDSTTEQIVVPMLKKKGLWIMR